MQNEQGQGVSHAVGDSKVPTSVQQKAPQGLEHSLPNTVHDTDKGTGRQTHALGDGAGRADFKDPLSLQKAVPEKLERALPDEIYNTGDSRK